MTPRRTSQNITHSAAFKWMMGGVMTAIVACVGFLWSVNRQLAEMQTSDRYRQEKMIDIGRNVTNLVEDVKAIKENDMQDIKDRLKTLEIKNEKK